MIAVSLDNLLFFLLIAVAALFQLLSKTISKAKKSDSNETPSTPGPQTPRPIQRASRESDADRIRKFLEALGQPPSSTPPSPVLPRTNIPARPLAPGQPPQRSRLCGDYLANAQRNRTSAKEQILPLNKRADCSKSFHQLFRLRLHQPSKFKGRSSLGPQQPSVKTAVESDAAGSEIVAKRSGSNTDRRLTLLASTSSLRQAILIREILGPPRGLQTLDPV